MNPNLTEIVCIMDRSGSMASLREYAINGFNTFVDQQRRLPGEARLTLVLFNQTYETPIERQPLKTSPALSEAVYVPSGKTALLDAIGHTIDDLGTKLAAAPENEKPSKVIISILTDGVENSSKSYTRTRVAEMIKLQQEQYSWQFLFMGANQDALAVGQALNIPPYHAATFAATSEGTHAAFRGLSRHTSIIRGEPHKRLGSPGSIQENALR